MIQEITQIQEIDNHHIDHPVIDHLQSHDRAKLPVRDIVIVTEFSTPTELHHAQEIYIYVNKVELLELFIILLSEIIVMVLFLHPPLEIDSILVSKIFHMDLHQNRVQDLRLHLADL